MAIITISIGEDEEGDSILECWHSGPESQRKLTIYQPMAEGGPLTVRELRAALADLPDDTIIVMAHDEEGNSYAPVAEVDTESHYLAETRYYGEVVAAEDGESYDGAVPCVVIWPAN